MLRRTIQAVGLTGLLVGGILLGEVHASAKTGARMAPEEILAYLDAIEPFARSRGLTAAELHGQVCRALVLPEVQSQGGALVMRKGVYASLPGPENAVIINGRTTRGAPRRQTELFVVQGDVVRGKIELSAGEAPLLVLFRPEGVDFLDMDKLQGGTTDPRTSEK